MCLTGSGIGRPDTSKRRRRASRVNRIYLSILKAAAALPRKERPVRPRLQARWLLPALAVVLEVVPVLPAAVAVDAAVVGAPPVAGSLRRIHRSSDYLRAKIAATQRAVHQACDCRRGHRPRLQSDQFGSKAR